MFKIISIILIVIIIVVGIVYYFSNGSKAEENNIIKLNKPKVIKPILNIKDADIKNVSIENDFKQLIEEEHINKNNLFDIDDFIHEKYTSVRTNSVDTVNEKYTNTRSTVEEDIDLF